MQLQEILSELENNTGTFPRVALERAIEEQESITPLLLANLEECKNNLDDLLDKPDYFLHIYALFLLAQFREAKLYPILIDFFSTPGEISLDLTGDVVTEYLDRMLASVCYGNIDPIKQLIENPEINEYVRGAALESLVILLAQGVLSREEIIEYFKELFANKIEKDNYYMWSQLVVSSCEICAIELKDQIDRVFAEDLVEQFFINEDNVNDSFKMGIEASLDELSKNHQYTLIDNTISELEDWACFRLDNLNDSFSSRDSFAINPELLNRVQSREKINAIDAILKKNKGKSNKKNKMQKESRRKNRSKKS